MNKNSLITLPSTVLAIFLLIGFISGCAFIDNLKRDDLGLRLTVEYSVAKLLEDKPERAARVLEVVSTVRTLASDSQWLAIDALAAEVRAHIHWERLSVADQQLLEMLLVQAQTELSRRMGEGLIARDNRVALITLLDWIEAAAAAQTASTAAETAVSVRALK